MKMLMLFVIVCMSAPSFAVDPVDANQTLSFEMSDQKIRWKESQRPAKSESIPVFYVGVAIEGMTRDRNDHFVPLRRDSRDVKGFRTFALSRDCSEQQKALMVERSAGLSQEYHIRIGKDGLDHHQTLLLAVSVEDAKRIGQAYFDYATERFGMWRADREQSIQKSRNAQAKAEARLSRLVTDVNTLQTEYDDLQAIIPYHSDEETLSAIAALNAMLNTISVDIAGIRSEIAAIQSYQRDRRYKVSSKVYLENMLLEHSSALKGAQARQETATGLRDQARRYAIITISLPELRRSIKETEKSIRNANYFIEKVERELSKATPPHVIDNVATLYPVSITSP